MLKDRILIQPLDWDASKAIIAIRHGRPVRGTVKAVGPGTHPKKYKINGEGQRQSFEYSKYFQPTEVQVGDVVELGGLNIYDGKGYQFQEIMIGTDAHIIIQEADICGVRE